MSHEWSHRLCSCFEDITTCILSWFCPWYVVGKNAEQVGDTCVLYALLDLCCFTVGVPLVGILLRASVRWKIREYKGIEGNFIKDCLLHYFCGPCALAQEAREVLAPRDWSMARE